MTADPHDTGEWGELVAATARLGVAAAQWDRARVAYLELAREGFADEQA